MTLCTNIQGAGQPHAFYDNWQAPSVDDLQTIEASLADQADERLRRVALSALFRQANYGQYTEQWTPGMIQRLQHYQDDPSPLVAGAALAAHPKTP